MEHRTRPSWRAWSLGLLLACVTGTAAAQVTLESVTNTAVANSGPTGDGPSPADQVVTLRHNTNNPTGTTMVSRTPAVTVTYRLIEQQFTGLTAAQGYPAGTGGNGVFFGGDSAVAGGSGAPTAGLVYHAMNALGTPSSTMFTSVNATSGQGIDVATNAGVRILVSTNVLDLQSPAIPTNARVRMADVELTFSQPVDDPILHVGGLGGGTGGATPNRITADLELITPGVTHTRLSGNSNFALTGSQIHSVAPNPASSCAANAACGSVRINGSNISTVTLRIFMRGDGSGTWISGAGSFAGDGFSLGVSVVEPTPTITVRKVSQGGIGTFDFAGSNGYTSSAVTTVAPNTAVAAPTRTLTAADTVTTITEAATTGYRLTDITCTGMGARGTATPTYTNGASVAGAVSLDAAATALGSHIQCTFTNEKIPIIRLRKALPHGRLVAGNQFVLSITGTEAPAAVTTTGTGTTANGVVTHSTATAGSTYTLSEAAAGATVLSSYTATYSCTNARAGGQTPSGSGTSFDLIPAAGDDLTCTFSNGTRPRVTIRKTSVNGTGSFTFSGSNGIVNQTVVTTTAGTPVSGAVQSLTNASTITTVTEGTLPANYTLTDITCTGLPAGGTATPNLATRQVVLNAAATAPGAQLVCTFTNTAPGADVRVEKSASADPATSGDVVTYTLVVTNDGPAAADGAVLTDTPGAGLDCTVPSATLLCAATGGATCSAATVPVATLLGAGMTIPALPAGGQVTATLQCTVTASGLP